MFYWSWKQMLIKRWLYPWRYELMQKKIKAWCGWEKAAILFTVRKFILSAIWFMASKKVITATLALLDFPVVFWPSIESKNKTLKATEEVIFRIPSPFLLFFYPSIIYPFINESYPTLCIPMDCSTRGFPVFHCLPEFAQTHVHWVIDAIQPSHTLSPPSPHALGLSQH